MTRPIRLGIIGTGIAARDLHWPALRELQNEFEIVALCNHTQAKAESFAELIGGVPRITTDYQELLGWSDVDAVDIALPIALNASVSMAALQAHKHVFLEKPIAADVASAHEVVAAAEKHPDLVLLVGENQRYDERFRHARRLLDRGRIGRPVMLHLDNLSPLRPDNPYAATTWRLDPEHLGGYLSDGGVHATAGLHVLAGRIDRVQGMITTFRPDQDPTDTLLANLHFESGAIGHLTYSVGVAREEPSPVRVYGTSGSIAIHDDHLTVTTTDGDEHIDCSGAENPYKLELLDFYRAVRDGKTPDVTPQDALADLAVIDAAFQSSRQGTTIDLS